MQTPKGLKSKCLEGHWRLLPCQQDGIARLLILSSTLGRPTRNDVLQVGCGERRRADNIDVKVTAFFPCMKTKVRTATLLTRHRRRKGGFPGNTDFFFFFFFFLASLCSK